MHFGFEFQTEKHSSHFQKGKLFLKHSFFQNTSDKMIKLKVIHLKLWINFEN